MAEIVNVSKTPDVLVLAHRGYWGRHSASPGVPENSLGSISAANHACMDGIELDVKMSKDGVPLLMHDFNLGRTTTIYNLHRQQKFDPMTNHGANPKVHDVLARDIDTLRLLTPDRRNTTGYIVPRVSQVLDEWKRLKMKTPLIFDTKTADAIRAIDILVRVKDIGGANTMAVKVNATLYPDPAGFYADAKNINVIPVYTTNMLGIISVADSLIKWSRAVQTIEINVKQKGGLLYFQKQISEQAGKRVGVFHAIPDGPISGGFYKNTGICCYKLSDVFYHHKVMGQPAGRDTEDHRGDLNFLLSQNYGLITSDDPKGTVRFLARAGKRRNHYQDY
ncbi:glycerophosphodiester phosphodiesterase family protein [Sphingomonas carotinifaciens]|uniref:Glycerophosphodiester phosphodiesterase n=1 Tax=Sphingomonas carotinifaciens TaxID=1166323 RepID=A0A1G7S4J9_9SPHN|nr:glycerophosphodiester phosphodiesterase family protein [Sphingomonas carotinifaciens]MBB4088187.1 hypothetical protein [Sphingomonas carotinifaciens]MWC42190.1 glycerophosphodiester phosphodiesterase [Sphingomonas carotinifaciens]SDG17933.1 Glycerophosphoryl diester phosphodiesterase family protein [Sphingomonas carotinifaciens]